MRRGLSQHFPSRHGPEPQLSGWHHSRNFSPGRLCLCPTGSQFKQPARRSQTVVCLGCVACEPYHTFPPAMQNVFGWKSARRSGQRELGCVWSLDPMALMTGHALQIQYSTLERREQSPCQAVTVIFSLEINSLYNQ